MTASLCCMSESNTLQINYTSIKAYLINSKKENQVQRIIKAFLRENNVHKKTQLVWTLLRQEGVQAQSLKE